MKAENPELRLRRLQWCCRRGMLELDLILNDFLNRSYPQISKERQNTFEKLLSCQDQELYDWLVSQKSLPSDPQLKTLIEQIRHCD